MIPRPACRATAAIAAVVALLAAAPAAGAHDGSGRSGSDRGGPHFPGDGRHGQPRDITPPAAPTASLPGGEVALPQTIHLSGENVRYTTDGSDPTAASTAYAAGISVTSALTIKAVAIDAAGNVSPVATFAYSEKPVVRVIQPTPDPVVVERPVAVVTQVVREVVREAPAAVVRPAAAAGIDRVAAPRRVSVARARKGVAVTVSTRAAFIRATASGGARVTAARKPGTGYALRFTAKRRGTYKVTIAVPDAAPRAVTIKVR